MSELIIDEGYLNSVCKVKTMENAVLAIGHIIEITNEGITVQNEPELPAVLNYNRKVKLSIFNDKLGSKTLIAAVYASTTKILKLLELQDISEFEKRTYYRLNVSLECEISLRPRDKDDDNEDKGRGTEKYEAYIENVSLSGLRMICQHRFDQGDRISVTMYTPFGKLEFISVIRRADLDIDDQSYNYGCEFEAYPDKLGDALWKYMMFKELEDIRKTRARGGRTPGEKY